MGSMAIPGIALAKDHPETNDQWGHTDGYHPLELGGLYLNLYSITYIYIYMCVCVCYLPGSSYLCCPPSHIATRIIGIHQAVQVKQLCIVPQGANGSPIFSKCSHYILQPFES